MRPKHTAAAVSFILLLLLAANVKSGVLVERTAAMNDVEQRITALGSKYGPERVLVVFDVDNTLLVMPRDLGSVAWWRWQVSLLKKGAPDPGLVAENLQELIQVQYAIFSLAGMTVTEERVPSMIEKLARLGYPMMALTARGPEAQGSTLRELSNAGIRFGKAPRCGPRLCAGSGIVSANDLLRIATEFFAPPKLRDFRFTDWVFPIGFADGVMSVSGQHKGALLTLLLDSGDTTRYAAIVFVDDDPKNIEQVRRAFETSDIAVEALHYTRYEADVRAFAEDKARQQKAARAWAKARDVLCDVFRKFC